MLPPHVQYNSEDTSATMVEAGLTPSPAYSTRKCPCTAMALLKLAFVVWLIVTVGTLTCFLLWGREFSTNAEQQKNAAASGITNLRLLAAADRYITVGWDKPTANFDFYLLDVTCGSGNDSLKECHKGSCGNGTLIPADQTQVTCGPFEACSRISVTVRKFSRGPPERTSMGTTLNDLFTPGQGPSEPKNITIHDEASVYGTTIQWEAPTRVHGILDVYTVKVCEHFTICDQMQGLGSCLECSTSDAWVDFESTEDTPYCVLITASARCGADVLTSPAATQEIRTPVMVEY